MFTGWLAFNGTEIINEARLQVYAQAAGLAWSCDPCPDLPTALGDAPYTTPAADNAPWYDPQIPESGDVLGFQILQIGELGDPTSRSVTGAGPFGSVVGGSTRSGRNLTLVVRAVAASACALTYAVAWLARALRGSECSTAPAHMASGQCHTSTVCMFRCCPSTPEDADATLVTLYRAGMSSGVAVLSTVRAGDEPCQYNLAEVEFTITAGDPGWYATPVTVIDTDLLPHFVEATTDFSLMMECSPSEGGNTDLDCRTIVPPGCEDISTNLPSQPPLPCIGLDPFDDEIVWNRYAFTIDTSSLGSWLDVVPRIRYQAGQQSITDEGVTNPQDVTQFEGPIVITMRRVAAGGIPCGGPMSAQDFACQTCYEAVAPLMPRATTGVIDGVDRRLWRVETPEGGLCAMPIYTRGLVPFNWPTLSCGAVLCVEVFIAATSDARDGHMSIELLRRYDAVA